MTVATIKSQIEIALGAELSVKLKTNAHGGLLRVTEVGILDIDTLEVMTSNGVRFIIPYHSIQGVLVGDVS